MKLTNKKNAIKINYGKNGVWGGRVLQKKEKSVLGLYVKSCLHFLHSQFSQLSDWFGE